MESAEEKTAYRTKSWAIVQNSAEFLLAKLVLIIIKDFSVDFFFRANEESSFSLYLERRAAFGFDSSGKRTLQQGKGSRAEG